MAKPKPRRAVRPAAAPTSRGKRLLLLFSAGIMLAGLALVVGAALGGSLIEGPQGREASELAGVAAVAAGFALSNLIQGHRLLAGGWVLVAAAVVVWLLAPGTLPVAAALLVAGAVIVVGQFVQRLNRRLAAANGSAGGQRRRSGRDK